MSPQIWAHVRPLPASVVERLVALLRSPPAALTPAADAVAAALLAPLLFGPRAAQGFGGWAAAHALLRLLGDRYRHRNIHAGIYILPHSSRRCCLARAPPRDSADGRQPMHYSDSWATGIDIDIYV